MIPVAGCLSSFAISLNGDKHIMNFGRTDPAELDKINLSLPPDAPGNKAILGGIPAANPSIYIGNPMWGSKHWLGKLYPAHTKEKQYAELYAPQFNSIELNATHYKIYDQDFVLKWKAKAEGYEFVFCPKMYNGVTHDGRVYDKQLLVQQFMESISYLQPYLGPVFIQLSDSFSTIRKQELYTFLESLPKEQQFFLEVRHEGWFSIPLVRKELFGLLKELNTGAVITDAPGRRDAVHMELAIPKAFVRFVGNNLHPTDYPRIDDWVKRIKHWLDNGLQELYFFMHMPGEMNNPELIVYMIDQLNASCGLNLRKPQMRNDPKVVQGRMFD